MGLSPLKNVTEALTLFYVGLNMSTNSMIAAVNITLLANKQA